MVPSAVYWFSWYARPYVKRAGVARDMMSASSNMASIFSGLSWLLLDTVSARQTWHQYNYIHVNLHTHSIICSLRRNHTGSCYGQICVRWQMFCSMGERYYTLLHLPAKGTYICLMPEWSEMKASNLYLDVSSTSTRHSGSAHAQTYNYINSQTLCWV